MMAMRPSGSSSATVRISNWGRRLGADTFGYKAELRVDKELAQLLRLRVAQINNCTYCLSRHYGVARGLGVSQAKIAMLSAWWETRLYSPAERAALTYAEALTRIKDTTVDSEFQRYHDQLGRPLRRRREPRHHRRCHQHEHLDPPEAR